MEGVYHRIALIAVSLLQASANVSFAVEASSEAIIGSPSSIHDADTLTLRGTRIRLHGVDAPELNQTCLRGGKEWKCGEEARNQLRELVGSKDVSCVKRDQDRYGRVVAVCNLSDGTNINSWLVSNGWAVAYRHFSKDFVADEDKAKTGLKGIWASQFVAPEEFRRHGTQRFPPSLGMRNTNDKSTCKIKGNVNARGDKIYHVPGSRDYDNTIIQENKGERWFCSEAEAAGAGFRPPRRP